MTEIIKIPMVLWKVSSRMEIPIVALMDALEDFYLNKLDRVMNSSLRDNLKLNEIENIKTMAEYYKLDFVVQITDKLTQKLLER